MKAMRMENGKRKSILASFCILLFALIVFGRAAYAEDYVQDKTGSINLTLQQTDADGKVTAYPNISMTLYQIGSVRYEMGAVYFDFDESFADAGISITDTKTASEWISAAQTLSEKVAAAGISGDTKVSDASGKISYSDLAQGIYLLVPTKTDGTVTTSPLLLTMPFMEDGDWTYDIASYPKLSVKEQEKPSDSTNPTPKKTETALKTAVPNNTVKTGDNSQILLWSGILIGAALLLLIVLFFCRRRKQR